MLSMHLARQKQAIGNMHSHLRQLAKLLGLDVGHLEHVVI